MDWDQVIAHAELMTSVIETEKRSSDWMAYVAGDKSKWAAGSTESEAIGELWRTWTEAIIAKIKES